VPRYLIQSCSDGVVWETRDACDTEPQYESGLDALEVFDAKDDANVTAEDVAAKYRVFDLDEQIVVSERPRDDTPSRDPFAVYVRVI
jgi:hypothetical protein